MTEALQPHRFTYEEWADLGPEFERTELIDGVVYDMAPEFAPHMKTVRNVFRALSEAFPDWECWSSGTLRLSDVDAVDPDVFVTEVMPEEGPVQRQQCVLAVGVSATTWQSDVRVKRPAYARAGIPQVWIVSPSGTLMRCAAPHEGDYIEVTTFEVGEFASGLDPETARGIFAGA